MNKIFKLISIIILFVIFSVSANMAAGPATKDQKILYKEGELLIKLKKGVQFNSISAELNNKKFNVKKYFANFSNQLNQEVYLINTDSNSIRESINSIRSSILEIKGIDAVSLNYARMATEIPNDPLFYQQWGLNNTGQFFYGYGSNKGTEGVDINAPELWNSSKGNSDVVIAVLDSGVDYRHEDLKNSMWTNSGEIPENGIDDDGNGYIDDYYGYDFGEDDSDPMDLLSINHGTHVAGIIAASQGNGIGISGISPNVKIMAIKGFQADGYLYTSDTIDSLNYIIKMKSLGINIVAVNCSFGSTGFSTIEKDAYKMISDAGIIITAAAGNGDDDGNSINNDTTSHYPSSYDVPNLISIAATDANAALGSFSNYGVLSVDLGAPGVAIKSTVTTGTGSTHGSADINGSSYIVLKMTYSKDTDGVSGRIYDCGKGLILSDFSTSVSGNIALIERGDATFAVKSANARSAGAIGVIIYNNESGIFSGTLGEEGNWPVVVSISREDGLGLKNYEGQTVSIKTPVSNYEFKSGTSMAAPHVAGAIGLIASLYPNESAEKRYLRTIFCGKLNDELSGKTKIGISLDLQSVLIQPVLGLTGERVANRSLMQTQYIDVISWQKNSQNYDHNISKYHIYRVEDGSLSYLTSVPSDTTFLNNTDLSRTKKYQYIVVPVSSSGLLGEPATVWVEKK